MRILETIAQTINSNAAHPTVVLNSLIELENAGGASAVYELEYRLARMCRTMFERQEPGYRMGRAWLEATRAYLEECAPVAPIPFTASRLREPLLKAS